MLQDMQMFDHVHINGLVQERHNSSALAMELHLSCINPSIYALHTAIYLSHFFLHHNYGLQWKNTHFFSTSDMQPTHSSRTLFRCITNAMAFLTADKKKIIERAATISRTIYMPDNCHRCHWHGNPCITAAFAGKVGYIKLRKNHSVLFCICW